MSVRRRRGSVFLALVLLAAWTGGPDVAVAGPAGSGASRLAQARTEPAATGAAALVGTWESVSRSKGGIGQIIELDQGGAMTRSVAAMVEFTYTLEGNRLVTSFSDARTGKAEKTATEIRFAGPDLIESAHSREVRMTRRQAGRPGDPPIVGVWTYPHEAGGTARVMYTADGRMIFRLPMRADRGTWSATATELTFEISGARSFRYRLDGERLVLTDDQTKQQEYRRAERIDSPRP